MPHNRGFFKDQRGNALIIFLIMVPMLILIITASIEITDTVTVADVDIQESLASACKAAAIQISDASQANGTPRINDARAVTAFENSLAYNLRLTDDGTLTPLLNTHYLSPPQFWLLIYNGDSDFAYDGANLASYYYFDGTNLNTESPPAASGFPATFYASTTGVNNSGGAYEVTLPSSGVVAVIQIEKKRVLGNVPVVTQRWASARIVWKSS
jgi:Flp pilus assembly protein TadG